MKIKEMLLDVSSSNILYNEKLNSGYYDSKFYHAQAVVQTPAVAWNIRKYIKETDTSESVSILGLNVSPYGSIVLHSYASTFMDQDFILFATFRHNVSPNYQYTLAKFVSTDAVATSWTSTTPLNVNRGTYVAEAGVVTRAFSLNGTFYYVYVFDDSTNINLAFYNNSDVLQDSVTTLSATEAFYTGSVCDDIYYFMYEDTSNDLIIASFDGSDITIEETTTLTSPASFDHYYQTYHRFSQFEFRIDNTYLSKRKVGDTVWSTISSVGTTTHGLLYDQDEDYNLRLAGLVLKDSYYRVFRDGTLIRNQPFTGNAYDGFAITDRWFTDATGNNPDTYSLQTTTERDGTEALGNWSDVHIVTKYKKAPVASLRDWSTTNQWAYRDYIIFTEDDGTQIFEGYADHPVFDGTSRSVKFFNPAFDDLESPVNITFTTQNGPTILKAIIDTYCAFIYYTTTSISTTPTGTYTKTFTGKVKDIFKWIDEEENYKGTLGPDGLYTWALGVSSSEWNWKRSSTGIKTGVLDWGTWDDPDLTGWVNFNTTYEVVRVSDGALDVLYVSGANFNWLYYPLPTTGTTETIQFRYKQSLANEQMNLQLVDSSSNVVCEVIFETDGNIDFQGTTLDQDLVAYSAETWINILITATKNGNCVLTVNEVELSTVTGGNFDIERLRFFWNGTVDIHVDAIGIGTNGYVTDTNTKQITDANAEQVDINPDLFQISGVRVIGKIVDGAYVDLTRYSSTSVGNEVLQKYDPAIATVAQAEAYGDKLLTANNVELNIINCNITGQKMLDYKGQVLFENGTPYSFTETSCYIQYNDYDALAEVNDPVLYDKLTYKQTQEEKETGDINPDKNFQAIGNNASDINDITAGNTSMDAGYTPSADQDIATKGYVDGRDYIAITPVALSRNNFNNGTSNPSGWGTYDVTTAFKVTGIPSAACRVFCYGQVQATVAAYGMAFSTVATDTQIAGITCPVGTVWSSGQNFIVELDASGQCDYWMGNISIDGHIIINVLGYELL